MNMIVDKKKAMDEYQKVIDDINSVRKDMWVTRSVFYKSCETVLTMVLPRLNARSTTQRTSSRLWNPSATGSRQSYAM